jgi:hypothetical protein
MKPATETKTPTAIVHGTTAMVMTDVRGQTPPVMNTSGEAVTLRICDAHGGVIDSGPLEGMFSGRTVCGRPVLSRVVEAPSSEPATWCEACIAEHERRSRADV